MTERTEIGSRGWGLKARGRMHRVAVSGLMAGALCSCTALTDPYVVMGTDVPATPGFEEAARFARDKAAEFDSRAADLARLDLGTGSLIFGSAIAGLGFAAFGAHSDAIIGAGLAGGAGAGARSFAPISTRIDAYKMGSSALHCAVTTIALGLSSDAKGRTGDPSSGTVFRVGPAVDGDDGDPLRGYLQQLSRSRNATGRSRLSGDPGATGLKARADAMQADAARSGRVGLVADLADVKAELRLLDRATRRVDAAARDLESATAAALDTRGQRLMGATGAIIAAVTDQISAARLDPDAAVKALRSGSAAMAKEIREAAAELKAAAAEAEAQTEKTDDALSDAKAEGMGAGAAGVEGEVDALAGEVAGQAAEVSRVALIAETIRELVSLSTRCLGVEDGGDDGDG